MKKVWVEEDGGQGKRKYRELHPGPGPADTGAGRYFPFCDIYKKGNTMPVITIDLGQVTPDVKAALIRDLTTTASEITKIPESSFFVFVREYPLDAIGVGGTPLSQMKLPPSAVTPVQK